MRSQIKMFGGASTGRAESGIEGKWLNPTGSGDQVESAGGRHGNSLSV